MLLRQEVLTVRPCGLRSPEEGGTRELGGLEGFLQAVGLGQNLPDTRHWKSRTRGTGKAEHRKPDGRRGWCLGQKVRPRCSSVWEAKHKWSGSRFSEQDQWSGEEKGRIISVYSKIPMAKGSPRAGQLCPERVMEVVRYHPQALHQRQPGVERRESGKGNNRGARCGLAAGSQR